jgi:hypothetical protein
MPKLHGFEEWLNDQAIIRKQTDKSHTVFLIEEVNFLRIETKGY